MNKLGKGLAASMATIITLSIMAVFPAHAVPSIYMVPASNPPPPGPYVSFKWNVSVYISGVTDLNAYQVNLYYEKSAGINATRAWLPTWDPTWVFYGRTTVGLTPVIEPWNATHNRVLVGDTILVGNTFSGDGILAVIEFHIIDAPGKYETLTTPLNIDNPKTILEDSVGNLISYTATDGVYTWTWTPPATNPWLEVVPSSITFPQETQWNGTPFDVDVVIKNLDVGWALHNATFTMKFNYSVVDVFGGVANITIDPLWSISSKNIAYDVPSPGIASIDVFVSNATTTPSGDVKVATITFTVINQKTAPDPYPTGYYDETYLDLQDVVLFDTVGPITQAKAPVDGYVKVVAYLLLATPYLTIDPAHTELGPDLVIGSQFGKEFTINVRIENLEERWQLIGIQFRLSFDESIVRVVSIDEGPYLPDPSWAPYGTFPVSFVEKNDPIYGTHIVFGDLILPNGTGFWNPPFPGFPPAEEGTGVIASITFAPLVQSWTETYNTTFEFLQILAIHEVGDIPIDWSKSTNGSLTILPIQPTGRQIDVWMLDPALGGEGLGEPADLVLPQTGLNLTAKVTYNWQPVSYKKVTFEIRGPFPHGQFEQGKLWAVLQDDTGDDGHAYAFFRMPWTGHNAEDLIGTWGVKVSVTLADVVITDYMEFDYDYLIHIWSVKTDKTEYMKSNDVFITVTYGTKSSRMHNVTMYATIQDELGVPIGIASLSKEVGGGALCNYANFTDTVTIHIPFWAYAGMATVRVSFVSGLPSEGGEAVAQEATATFYILPVHFDDPWFTDP